MSGRARLAALFAVGVALGCEPTSPAAPRSAVASTGGWNALGATPDVDHQLNALLDAARAAGRPTLVDFWATWCVPCKKLDQEVFPAPAVKAALSGFVRIKVDVTADTKPLQRLQAAYSVTSMPTILFFGPDGALLDDLRISELVDEETLLATVARIPCPTCGHRIGN